MNELEQLVSIAQRHPATVLATVVETEGSVYRRAGARLLIAEGIPLSGGVSGGCLEADVAERATELQAGPILLRYDTSAPEDVVWGMGLGCEGVVQILLERTPAALLNYYSECLLQRKRGLVATVYRGAEFGRRYYGTQGLPSEWVPSAELALSSGRSQHWHNEVLLEVVNPPTSLLICGAGPDAVPVARIATELGWNVRVVDHRPAYIERGLFPEEVVTSRLPLGSPLTMDQDTVALVMAHHAQADQAYLSTLLASPAAYIGMLGPRKRTRQFLEQLGGLDDPRVFYPVGLDIGAETPHSIALAMLAEITAVLAGRQAGFLKDRPGPIHAPEPEFSRR